MVQGFHSDDANFFPIVNNVNVAADGSVVEKYKSLGFSSSKRERIATEDPIETQSYSYISESIIQFLVKSPFYKKIRKLPPLNLKLDDCQSLAFSLDTLLSEQPKRADLMKETEKMKASNFPALLLEIGSWQRVTRHEGDLVAKCYYAKKKLVWEFLEMSLKRKIEIQWADIMGIRATIEENEPGILQLELKQPPTFHYEIDPQPRKHTNWRVTQDFTEGQALLCRIHTLKFPPGVLDRHFEKLLQCDIRLFELSQKHFPTLDSPRFQPSIYGISEFSLNFSGQRPQIYNGLHFPHSHMNPSLFSSQQVQSYHQPTIQMQPSFSLKDSSSPDSGMGYWVQATNNFPTNQLQGQYTNSSTTPPLDCYQNNNYTETFSNYTETCSSMGGGDLYNHMLIDSIENALMNDSNMDNVDEKRGIASFEALINQANNYGQDISAGSDIEFSANDHSNDTGAGHVAWMLPQGSDNPWLPAQATQEMPMSQHSNSLVYQMGNDFATYNHNGDSKYT